MSGPLRWCPSWSHPREGLTNHHHPPAIHHSWRPTIDTPPVNYLRETRPINGTFRGRGRDYLSLLACPVDGAPLRLSGEALRCTTDSAHVYPFERGVLRLVPAGRAEAVRAISNAHDAQGAAAGWKSPDEGEFKSLPQTALPGYPPDYWPQQADATALLWRFLEAARRENGTPPVGPAGEAAVIGAEMGWLAYGLDVAGYATLALDARAGEQFGLGAYPIARYLRVQVDPAQLGLARGAFDWIVIQGGLAGYGDDDAQAAVFEQAVRALRAGGSIAILDRALSEGQIVVINRLFRANGLDPLPVPQRLTWRGRLRDLRDRLANGRRSAPPVLVARKPKG